MGPCVYYAIVYYIRVFVARYLQLKETRIKAQDQDYCQFIASSTNKVLNCFSCKFNLFKVNKMNFFVEETMNLLYPKLLDPIFSSFKNIKNFIVDGAMVFCCLRLI